MARVGLLARVDPMDRQSAGLEKCQVIAPTLEHLGRKFGNRHAVPPDARARSVERREITKLGRGIARLQPREQAAHSEDRDQALRRKRGLALRRERSKAAKAWHSPLAPSYRAGASSCVSVASLGIFFSRL